MHKIVLIVICSFFIYGCQLTPNLTAATDSTDRLEGMYISGNYSGLIKIYQDQLVENINDDEARLNLAEVYFLNDDIESAEFYLRHDFSTQEHIAKSHFITGNIHVSKLEFGPAIESYKAAEVEGYNHKELYMQAGIAMAQMKNFPQAINYFDQARIRGYDELVIKNNIGLTYIYQGEYQKAIDILLPASLIDKSNETLKSNLDIAYIALREQEQSSIVNFRNDISDDLNRGDLSSDFSSGYLAPAGLDVDAGLLATPLGQDAVKVSDSDVGVNQSLHLDEELRSIPDLPSQHVTLLVPSVREQKTAHTITNTISNETLIKTKTDADDNVGIITEADTGDKGNEFNDDNWGR